MFVLIHGAWHGKWCWERTEQHIRDRGGRSVSVDLPGRAGDTRHLSDLTLESYVDVVVAALEKSPEPAVLVGHSLGGLVISQTAERVPERISSLVYLCAMLLKDGESTMDIAATDPDSQLVGNISLNEACTASSVDPAAVRDLCYGDCTVEESENAIRLLVPEPIGPASTPLQVSEDRYGTVPRSYILCAQDRAISPVRQQAMIDSVGVDRVAEVDTSHSPFLSQPDRLAAVLMDLGA
jgi:pimeloyl-ACP methyl ester carboxylesterase